MARQRRKREELRAASDHLYYEVMMLRGTMANLARSQSDPVLRNALIESFTVHSRAVIHFLYPSGKIYSSDVLAEDFFDAAEDWNARVGPMPEAFKTARGRVDKEIVHLTYDRQRVTPDKKAWDPELGERILALVEIFRRNVRQDLLGGRWQARADAIVFGSEADDPKRVSCTDASTPGSLYD